VADGEPPPPKWMKWDDVKWKKKEKNRTIPEKGDAIFFFSLLNAKLAYEYQPSKY